jgi:hypothetical protein
MIFLATISDVTGFVSPSARRHLRYRRPLPGCMEHGKNPRVIRRRMSGQQAITALHLPGLDLCMRNPPACAEFLPGSLHPGPEPGFIVLPSGFLHAAPLKLYMIVQAPDPPVNRPPIVRSPPHRKKFPIFPLARLLNNRPCRERSCKNCQRAREGTPGPREPESYYGR